MRKSNGQFGKGNPGKPKGAKHKRSQAAEIKEQLENITTEMLTVLDEQVKAMRQLPASPTGIKDVSGSAGVLLNYVLPKKSESLEFTHDHLATSFEGFASYLSEERGIVDEDLGRLKGLMVDYLDYYAEAKG